MSSRSPGRLRTGPAPRLWLGPVLLLAAGLLSWLPFAGCDRTPAAHDSGSQAFRIRGDYDLVLISIDTLRADRLGSYGYDRPTSPHLDALAARGVRFDQALSVSAWTLPAHMSFFTGLRPSSHGATRYESRVSDETTSLAEILSEAGYRTFGRTSGGYLARRFGFARGFDEYTARLTGVRGLMQMAREDVESVSPGERYFLFVQTFSVHCPYSAPRRYVEMFRTVDEARQVVPRSMCFRDRRLDLNADEVQGLSDRYDASIRFVDDAIGAFVDWLDARGAFRDTVLIVLSDHGEEIFEHGDFMHSRTLYQEILRVPFIVVAPGLEPRVVREPVSVVDVLPTVLELVDAPEGDAAGSDPQAGEAVEVELAIEGRSLMGLMRGEAGAVARARKRPILAETNANDHPSLEAIVHDGWKLVVDRETGAEELFDLANDPGELHDLAPAAPPQLDRLRSKLERARARPRGVSEVAPAPSAENLRALRELGYVE